MKKSTKTKIKAILTWYKLTAPHLTDEKKLRLLKMWKQICIEHEEYEIASSLRKERCKLVRKVRLKKIGKRTFFKSIILRLKIVKRKVKKLLF